MVVLLKTIPSKIKDICLIISTFSIFYLLSHPLIHNPTATTVITTVTPPPTTLRHLSFSIASSHKSYQNRKPYIRLWYNPNTTNAVVFLDQFVPSDTYTLPRIIISKDTSHFPYTFPKGLRSAIRVARIVKETVETYKYDKNIRWFVFGDDDTVFFNNNLVNVLRKYDYNKWYYIGSGSESYQQNLQHSFGMAFGGAGFVLSRPLCFVLAKVLDSCLMRYSHVYGSDSRIFSCLIELGVHLTHEPGFHQVDVRGNIFGILAAHPLSPLLSLHHFDIIDPIFPGLTKLEAVKHLYKAVKHDPARILQQTVCYDSANLITISVSWGYAVQVFEGNRLLPDLIQVQKTFSSWRRKENFFSSLHMFNTLNYNKDMCKSPDIFFLEGVSADDEYTLYKKKISVNCTRSNKVRDLTNIKVFSTKLHADTEQMTPQRRQCCDIVSPYSETMVITLRHCEIDELIAMHP